MNGRLLIIAATGFCLTTISARWWPELPRIHWPVLMIMAASLLFMLSISSYCIANRFQKPMRLCSTCLFGAGCGICMAASLGQSYLKWQQLGGEIQQDVIIEGRVVYYYQHIDHHRIILDNIKINHLPWDQHFAVQLNYYRPEGFFAQGQRIYAEAKIKPARANANPHGFDMQQWYVSQRIVKTGYIKGQMIRLAEPDISLRSILKSRLLAMQLSAEKWLLALLFGDRQGFTQTDWQLLQTTGTAHLFAISGLHLVIVAAVVMLIIKMIALVIAMSGVLLPPSAKLCFWLIPLFCCGFYAYLANWQTAVLRAFLMLCIVCVGYSINSRQSRISILIWTLSLCIVFDPASVFGTSLYLSAGAVAIILLFHWWFNSARKLNGWREFVTLQFFLSLLMAPLVMMLLGQFSILSPLINLLVVPVMGTVIVPLSLTGLIGLIVLPEENALTGWLMYMVSQALDWLMHALSEIDRQAGSFATVDTFQSGVFGVIAFVLGLCLFPAFKGRGCLVLVFVLCGLSHVVEHYFYTDQWQVHIFDVGQGNAALITRNGEAVLFDTGAGSEGGFNFIDAVILPFIKAQRLTLATVYISHFDNDHAGGLPALQSVFPDVPVFSPHDSCVRGAIRQWQGLVLTVMWPPVKRIGAFSENNASCVVKVSDGVNSILFAGDIELEAESEIVAGDTDKALASTILLSPHHGSKTSSSALFVERVQPEYAVFSQGWLNRWRFPDKQVRSRYAMMGAKQLLVSETGYLRFEMKGDLLQYEAFRQSSGSKWFHKTFSN